MKSQAFSLLCCCAALSADQFSKAAILASAAAAPGWTVEIAPFFSLVLVRNDGVSFGLFGDYVPWWGLSVIAILIISFLVRWVWHENSLVVSSGLGLIIGGAIGNVLDRFRHGGVTDFLDFHISGWHWPAFNLADVAIFFGVICVLWVSVRPRTSTG